MYVELSEAVLMTSLNHSGEMAAGLPNVEVGKSQSISQNNHTAAERIKGYEN